MRGGGRGGGGVRGVGGAERGECAVGGGGGEGGGRERHALGAHNGRRRSHFRRKKRQRRRCGSELERRSFSLEVGCSDLHITTVSEGAWWGELCARDGVDILFALCSQCVQICLTQAARTLTITR